MGLNSRSAERRLFRNRKFRREQHQALKIWQAFAKYCNTTSELGRRIARLLQH